MQTFQPEGASFGGDQTAVSFLPANQSFLKDRRHSFHFPLNGESGGIIQNYSSAFRGSDSQAISQRANVYIAGEMEGGNDRMADHLLKRCFNHTSLKD